MNRRLRLAVSTCSGLFAMFGLLLLFGGMWLTIVGGSWFYLIYGVVLLAVGWLLVKRPSWALLLYALALLGTLAWALLEANVDWWPLAARGGVPVVLGLLLLFVWAIGALGTRIGRQLVFGAAALTAVVAFTLIVAVASWSIDLHQITPQPQGEAGTTPELDAGGDWLAYGGTNMGQRYSPLSSVTTENVAQLRSPGLSAPEICAASPATLWRRPSR